MNAIPSLLTSQRDIWITAETERIRSWPQWRQWGKLVPQEPNDKLADELLKRI